MKRLLFTVLILVFAMFQNVVGQVLINVGTVANDGTGDALRLAMGKANTNFTTVFGNATTVSNNVLAVAANLTTVSNSVNSVAANLTTVSNSVNSNAANITTVSNRLTTDIANVTVVSNNVTSVSANVSAVAANLTTVSNSVNSVSANLTTVSNSLTGKINAQTGTVYAFVAGDSGRLTTFSNAAAVAVSIGSFADGVVFHAKNLGTALVTLTPSAATVDGVSSLVLARGQSASVFSDGQNYQTTLRLPNLLDQVSNVLNIVNPSSPATAQRIDLYSSTDSVQTPVNYGRMQIFPNQIDFDEVGTGSLGGQFRITYNNTSRQVFDLLNAVVLMGNNGVYGWTSSSTPGLYGQDTILRRKSAGVVSASTVSAVNDLGQFSSINGLSVGSIFTQTADATAGNSTNEVTIFGAGSGSKTVAANAINTVGRTLRVKIRGMISNYSGSPTLTVRFKISGTAYLTGVLSMVNATDNDFECEILMTTRSTGTGASFSAVGSFSHGMTAGTAGRMSLVYPGTQVVDLTTSKTVDVTAQWSVAHVSNTITSQVVSIEILN